MVPEDQNKQMIEQLGSKNVAEAFGAIKNLKRKGKEALPYLMKAIEESEESIRVMAVVVLGEMEKEAIQAIPVLLELFNEQNEQMRMAAALALVRMGDDSIQPLMDYLKSSDKLDSFWASWSLALLNASLLEEKSIKVLYEIQQTSSNPVEKMAAEEALGKIIGDHLKS
ncbi:HEAT repeat domain-containing protein [Bacillus smithii]|uniref:HEAT repeat domain-containing protein n=1 Tax=Bacillus smithii TaxID=1479 RepID=UPI002E1F95AC|nr:HEAT repeat domain-containing protein [Bacillus smithii]